MAEILLKVTLNTINHLYLISETVVTLSTPMYVYDLRPLVERSPGQFIPVPICPNFLQNGYIFSSLKILKKCVCL